MKKLAIICALAMVMTMIAPFAAVSAATDTNGVLYWDFETTDDVAEHGAASSAWQTAKNPDLIGSGAWCRQIPTVGPVFGHPWLTSFDKLYLADGNSAWNLITQAETDANFSSLPLANGGEKCIAMYSADGGQGPKALGPVIQLEDTKLIPDTTYTLEFDVLTSSAYPKAIWAGFSKPSERPSGAVATASFPWFVTGNAKMAKVSDEDKYAVNTAWKHMTVEVTPSASMYESGNILFYIAGGDVETQSPSNAKEWLYLDNIKLTPGTIETDIPVYTKFTYGKVWDFENDYGVDDEGNYVIDKGVPGHSLGGDTVYLDTFAAGNWSLISDTNGDAEGLSTAAGDGYFRGPKVRSVEDAKLYNNTLSDNSEGTDDGYNGTSAPGSEYCVRVRPHNNPNGAWNKGTLGIRLRLDENEFPAGNYTLSFYSGWTKASSDGFSVCASIFAGDKIVVDTGTAQGDMTAVTESFADATQTFTIGSVGRQWAKYTQDIELTDADFDDNGVATLILHTNIAQLPPSAMLYFDDISLISETDMIPSSGVRGFVTTASYTDIEDAMIAAGLYYEQEASYLIDADSVKGDIGRVTHSNIKLDMVGDAYDEGWPTAKIYIFNKFFAPILDTPLTFE